MEMLTKEMKAMQGDLQRQFKGISNLLDGFKGEMKTYGRTTEESRAKMDELDAGVQKTMTEMVEAKSRLEQMEVKANRLPTGPGGEEFKSIGDRVCEDKAFENWMTRKAGVSEEIKLKNFFRPDGRMQYKAVDTGSEAAIRTIWATLRLQEMFLKPHRQNRMRDVIPVVQTTAGQIAYIRQTSYASNAQPVAQLALKPESNIAYEIATKPVTTLAHYMPVARQLVDDAAGLRGWIDQELTLGLKDVEDTQILWGSGIGENLSGIMTDGGIQTYSWSSGRKNDTRMDAIRRAMTKVTVSYFVPSAIVLHPFDWEDIELTKTSFGSYVWVNPQVGGTKQLWRLDVVETTAMTPGDFLVGAFDRGCTLWDREEVGVRIADQHADFFLRNAYVILVEERLCLTVFRPDAFVFGTFDAPPSGSAIEISGSGGSYPHMPNPYPGLNYS